MKRLKMEIQVLTLIAVLAICCTGVESQATSPKKMDASLLNANLRLSQAKFLTIVYNITGAPSRCTGSLLLSGEVATATHCITSEQMGVVFSDNRTCTVAKVDKRGSDVSVLKLAETCDLSNYAGLEVHTALPPKGLNLLAIGFPMHDFSTAFLRSCSTILANATDIYTDCFTDLPWGNAGGASGGPLIYDGKLIGVFSTDYQSKTNGARVTKYGRIAQ